MNKGCFDDAARWLLAPPVLSIRATAWTLVHCRAPRR